MSSMIERIARTLCTQHGQNPDRPIASGPQRGVRSEMRRPGEGPFAWENFTSHARALLTAMREPTEAMAVDAIEYEASNGRATSQHVWRAMIDAALQEQEI